MAVSSGSPALRLDFLLLQRVLVPEIAQSDSTNSIDSSSPGEYVLSILHLESSSPDLHQLMVRICEQSEDELRVRMEGGTRTHEQTEKKMKPKTMRLE
jgi:hypothetical protein